MRVASIPEPFSRVRARCTYTYPHMRAVNRYRARVRVRECVHVCIGSPFPPACMRMKTKIWVVLIFQSDKGAGADMREVYLLMDEEALLWDHLFIGRFLV